MTRRKQNKIKPWIYLGDTLHITKVLCRNLYQGQGQVITPHRSVGCNYMSLPLIAASGATILIYHSILSFNVVSPDVTDSWGNNITWLIILKSGKLKTTRQGISQVLWLKILVKLPDSKVHGANMGPTWVLSAPDGPHGRPMNLAITTVQELLTWPLNPWPIYWNRCSVIWYV